MRLLFFGVLVSGLGCSTDYEDFTIAGPSAAASGGASTSGTSSASAGNGGGGNGQSSAAGGLGGSGGSVCPSGFADCNGDPNNCEALDSNENCGSCGHKCSDDGAGFECNKTTLQCGCHDDGGCNDGQSGTCDKTVSLCTCGSTVCGVGEKCIDSDGSPKCSCGGSSCPSDFLCLGGECLCTMASACQWGGSCDVATGHCMCPSSPCSEAGPCKDDGCPD